MKVRSIVILVVVGVFVMFGGLGYYAWKTQKEKKATVVDESASERADSIHSAFVVEKGQAAEDNHVKYENITKDRFAKLAKALDEEDDEVIGSVVSAKHMFEYAESAGLLNVPSKHRKNVIGGMSKGLVIGFKKSAGLMGYDEVDVVRVEPIKENEFIAYTRVWNDQMEIYSKMRWWFLGVGENQWVVYDYEDFDTNIRASTMMGAAFTSMKGGSGWAKDMLALSRLLQGADAENVLDRLIDAEDKAQVLLKHPDTPHSVQGFARIMLVSSLLAQENFADALVEVDVLLKKHPDVPVAYYSKGTALMNLEKWDESIACFNIYAGQLGWDADVYELISDAYRGKGDQKKANEHAAKGLADNSNSYGCLVSYALTLPKDDPSPLLKHIQKTKVPENAYEYVMNALIEDGDMELAKWLLVKLKAAFPDSDLIDYYEEELAKPVGGEDGEDTGQ